MIPKDSVLRRLPAGMDRRQVLFLDGIRHAGEIAALAHQRLRVTLTKIASDQPAGEQADALYTSAFLDAWALVDVIDRFRTLWDQLPGRPSVGPGKGGLGFNEISRPVRSLRNVADHLAQRADYVVSRRGSALGVLSWCTVLHSDAKEAFLCTILPGSLKPTSINIPNPGGEEIEVPSGFIHLSAGEYTANLSAVLPEMECRIRGIESSLAEVIRGTGEEESRSGADLLVKMVLSFGEPVKETITPVA